MFGFIMSEEENQEDEPSIEEILDSIRQIISDDEEVSEVSEVEVESVEDVSNESEPEPEPEQESDNIDDVVELTDRVDDVPEPVEPEPEPVEPEPEPVEISESDSDTVLTEKAEDAAYEGFSELVKKTAVEHNGITLEDIVRSELNPLLRQWLDKNLPKIIERLVQEELGRISKRTLEE